MDGPPPDRHRPELCLSGPLPWTPPHHRPQPLKGGRAHPLGTTLPLPSHDRGPGYPAPPTAPPSPGPDSTTPFRGTPGLCCDSTSTQSHPTARPATSPHHDWQRRSPCPKHASGNRAPSETAPYGSSALLPLDQVSPLPYLWHPMELPAMRAQPCRTSRLHHLAPPQPQSRDLEH